LKRCNVKLLIGVSTEAEPSSSLPSPPASSPPPRSPTPSNGEAARSPEVPTSSPFLDASQSPSPNIQQLSTNILARHDIPTTLQPQSTEKRYTTPTFASLSSPVASPALSAVPGSPSFDSLVYEATSGKRKRTDERFPRAQSPSSQLQNSQESQNSFSSCGSQDAVERQLTQSMDLDDDDTEYRHPRAQITRSQAESENAITSQKDEVIYRGELDWPAESSRMSSSHQQSSQTTPSRSLPPLQTQRHSPPTVSTLNTPTGTIHTPTTSVRKQQPWYGHPQKKRKSRQSSGVLVANVYQTDAGLSVSKPSMMHSTQGGRPSRDANSRPSGNVFQSGTLQITPPAQLVHGGSTHDAGSQSRSPIGWSQTQTQTSWILHESCPPLQTQAPYQSQSSSQ
jgi:hypothetical protein